MNYDQAEATLRAIQEENSTFIQQCRAGIDKDYSYISADLRQTQQELKTLDDQPMSEFQTTTIHDAYNNADFVDSGPQFVDDQTQIHQNCPKCEHVMELNEALQEENERLRDHMESMILMVQQFDLERTRLVD